MEILTHFYVDELIFMREKARARKNYLFCDQIRDHLDEKLIFIFDTKEGQEIHYLAEKYFENKSISMSNREFVEYKIKQDIRANKNFDAWLYSVRAKL